MSGRHLQRIVVGWALAVWATSAYAADEFSGADKLRAIYSAEFRFTEQGFPVVPVAIAEGLARVTISAGPSGGLRLFPEGEGSSEVRGEESWQVRASATLPAKLSHWAVVWRGKPGQGDEADAHIKRWKELGEKAKRFEQGTVFGVGGEVLDRREILVVVGPYRKPEEAEQAFEALGRKQALVNPGVFTELVDRPHGQLEAVGSKTGMHVRNEGVLWFVAGGDSPLQVEAEGPAGKTTSKVSGAYFGKVYVTLDHNGSLAVVNALPEDRFLAGLLPAEIFPNAPDEALKAQAVAARGELLSKIGTRHLGDPFRLCSQTHCQVYLGAGHETPRTTAAVAATRGEVLFTDDGKDLADTVYSANCGGHTENNENAWPAMPALAALRGHRDAPAPVAGKPDVYAAGVSAETVARFIDQPPAAYCGQAHLGAGDRFRWTAKRTAAELDKLLGRYRLGEIRAIEVPQRGVSGRALAVRVVGSARSETIRGELRIRQAFGGLRSSLFVVEVKDGGAVFHGAGFGHGVGMCQTGAVGMAEAGKKYREILRHYYPNTALRKLW
ncbi:MAG TPA: SpoIID/LytB domain-containing protein [Polyangia bacterium]|jgi:SpoIID/LytB domain|nr:SpoIID/LytB domain-containing protein [Polyangia bacterium]